MINITNASEIIHLLLCACSIFAIHVYFTLMTRHLDWPHFKGLRDTMAALDHLYKPGADWGPQRRGAANRWRSRTVSSPKGSHPLSRCQSIPGPSSHVACPVERNHSSCPQPRGNTTGKLPVSPQAGESQDRQGKRHAGKMEKESGPTHETPDLGVIAGRSECSVHLIKSRLPLEVQVFSHNDLKPICTSSHHHPSSSP